MRYDPDRYGSLRALLRGRSPDAELAEELSHHIELLVEENIRRGMTEAAAWEDARVRFGDLEQYRHATRRIDRGFEREKRRMELFSDLRREVSQTFRSLLRTPGFAITAVVTLGLGLGATTGMYAVLNGVVLKPLPYPQSERLAFVDHAVPGVGAGDAWGLSEVSYHHHRANATLFDALAVYSTMHVNIAGDGGALRVPAARASRDLLPLLGAEVALGRLFDGRDHAPGGPSHIVLGFGAWQRLFGGSHEVVGSTVRIEGFPYEVLGVLARPLDLPQSAVDVWLPMQLDPAAVPVNSHYLSALGRLAPGASWQAAQRELEAETAHFPELYPDAYYDGFMERTGFAPRVQPLSERVIGESARSIWITLAAVSLLLLIACLNVANLLLVRFETRRQERLIRGALGASRAHMFAHAFAEALLIALTAAALAMGVAYAGVRTLTVLAPASVPRLGEVRVDGGAVLFCLLGSVAIALLFATLPLVRGSGGFAGLRDGARSLTPSRGRQRVRNALVVAQVALAVMLLAAGGVLIRTVLTLRGVDAGFEPRAAMHIEVSLPVADYQTYDDVAAFWDRAHQRIGSLPGIRHVGGVSDVPLLSEGFCSLVFTEPGWSATDEAPCVASRTATPGFAAALGARVSGREPTWDDVRNNTGAVLVTRALAERLWPGTEPIGRGIRGNGPGDVYYRVVGIIEGLRAESLDADPSEIVYFPVQRLPYAPLWSPARTMQLVVRTEGEPLGYLPSIRTALAELDRSVPVGGVGTLEQIVSRSIAERVLVMMLLGTTGIMALLLSAIGLYGVIGHLVAQRRGEMGVRIALGSSASDVMRLVLGSALRLTLIGIALGMAGAWVAMRAVTSLLYDTRPMDPLTLLAVCLLLLIVSAAAAAGPAIRAARTDPLVLVRAS